LNSRKVLAVALPIRFPPISATVPRFYAILRSVYAKILYEQLRNNPQSIVRLHSSPRKQTVFRKKLILYRAPRVFTDPS